ncbi:hypothetical protein BDB01DRAFT_785908 [Pilobolus umbonatus]|nr:hypothetical protein BDB01DRAFT_785908 [Pilobolus umbonatus]
MSTPSSPIPRSTETTRLLNTSNNHYGDASTSITIQPETNGYPQARSIVSGAPTIPSHLLTEKIQDILIFTEVKKNQQERLMEESRRRIPKKASRKTDDSSSSSSSSSSSDSDSDDNSTKRALKKKLSEWSLTNSSSASLTPSEKGKRVRKRDFAVDAFRFATDKWKDKHGFPDQQQHQPVSGPYTRPSSDATKQAPTYRPEKIPSAAESILKVAKNASVCAVLALLHERRQSSGKDFATDISLQKLALETLTLSLDAQVSSTSHIILYDMLTTKWLNNKCALEWAYENNCQLILNDPRVQAVIEEYWIRGPKWREDPEHPSYMWLKKKDHSKGHFAWNVTRHTVSDYLAKWTTPRYQGYFGLFIALTYLFHHLRVVGNLDYTSDTPFSFEYTYYFYVVSDLLLESYRLFTAPKHYLSRLSSYITLGAVFLLTYSSVTRFCALYCVDDIEGQNKQLYMSYTLLILATPLMFFRLLTTWTSDVFWFSAKINYILGQCIRNGAWVFGLSILTIVGFWVALGAFQYEDVPPVTMLRLLILGALHAPQIGNTLFYQPQIASILLSIYLFLTVIVMGSLLVSSFISTMLEINPRLDTIKKEWTLRRNLTPCRLNTFIVNVIWDGFIGFLHWTSRVIFRRQHRLVWIDKLHQVGWYVTYLPNIILLGIIQLVIAVLFKWKVIRSAFSRSS